jgi:hypothetical protein
MDSHKEFTALGNPKSLGYSLVSISVPAKGFLGALRLRRDLRGLLRKEGFIRLFPLNRHYKQGTTVTYNLEFPLTPSLFRHTVDTHYRLNLGMRIKSPTEETDKLVEKILSKARLDE